MISEPATNIPELQSLEITQLRNTEARLLEILEGDQAALDPPADRAEMCLELASTLFRRIQLERRFYGLDKGAA